MSSKSFNINVSFNLKAEFSEECIKASRSVFAKGLAEFNTETASKARAAYCKALQEQLDEGDDALLAWVIRHGIRGALRDEVMETIKGGGGDGLEFKSFSPFTVEVTPRGN